eukprot:TRINITY_DN1276_c0_g2_i1.p1 TRINITY_DN1276_c0_g2~~TRINITY_DN1276_c0_g2_i1.p1  ORF type:complete len:411 (-),score=67.03 TRINITY_DN1276_c0_g2_i1:392-1624(-)
MARRVLGLVVAIVLICMVNADSFTFDACYGVSVCPGVVANAVAGFQAINYTRTSFQNFSDVTPVIGVLYNALYTTLSPFGFSAGVAFLDNSFMYLHRCSPYISNCAWVDPDPLVLLVVAPFIYGDAGTRYFRFALDNQSNPLVDIQNPVHVDPKPFLSNIRPWFNASSWSPGYVSVNTMTESRMFVNVMPTGMRVYSFRNSEEPCSACYSRSPCVGLAGFIAGNAPLDDWDTGINTKADLFNLLKYMFANYFAEWQIQQTINSIGMAFTGNNNTYLLTDCSATQTAPPECQSGAFMFETRNVAIFGNDHLYAFSLDGNGNVINPNTPRDEQSSYAPQTKPWYIRGSGWSDNFVIQNGPGSIAQPVRAYSRWFYNGVAVCVANNDRICPGLQTAKRGVEGWNDEALRQLGE